MGALGGVRRLMDFAVAPLRLSNFLHDVVAVFGVGATSVVALASEVSLSEPVADDLEWKEVLALLAQHPPQPLYIGLEELPVTRRRSLRVDQPLAFQEADLRDGDVGEFLSQQRENVTDREIRTPAHSFPATK
jgi:hypothetical protein